MYCDTRRNGDSSTQAWEVLTIRCDRAEPYTIKCWCSIYTTVIKVLDWRGPDSGQHG